MKEVFEADQASFRAMVEFLLARGYEYVQKLMSYAQIDEECEVIIQEEIKMQDLKNLWKISLGKYSNYS